jgi:hypothetical protein
MGGSVERTGEKMNAYAIFIGKPEGTGPQGGSKSRKEDNVNMVLREIGWILELDSSGSGQRPVIKLRIP